MVGRSMAPKQSKRIIYSSPINRSDFIKKCFWWPVNHLMHWKSKNLLLEKNRQMVIFAFDHIGHQINLNGVYEKNELDTFFKWAKSIGFDFSEYQAIDIGANIGNHSLYFSDYFKSVISFEPNPRTYKVLLLNSDLVSNITCINVGLSDVARETTLYIHPCNLGGSSIANSNAPYFEKIKLDLLDSYTNLSNVALIKVDVEGCELQVLRGAKTLILKENPFILFEQHTEDFKNGKSEVISELRAMGYEQFAYIKSYPKVLDRNFVLKFLVSPMVKLLIKNYMKVILTNDIRPDFYSFIIAIPKGIKC